MVPTNNVHAQSTNTIIVGTTDAIPTLDWADAYDYMSSNILVQISHGLFELPRNGTTAIPVVASGVSISSDGLTYTFTIRSGLKFTDGSNLRVEDIIWSLKRAETLPGDPSFLLAGIDSNSYQKISNTSFSLKLTYQDGTFLQRLSYTNAWVFKEDDSVTDTLQGADYTPVGLGPYTVTTWVINERIVLEKSQYYSAATLGQPEPANDKVIVQFFTNSANLQNAVEGGTIDVAFHSFTTNQFNSLKYSSIVNHATAPSVGIRYLIVNDDAVPDKAVRQSISLAINRTEFVDSIFSNTIDPLYSMVPSSFSNACHQGDNCAFPNSPNQAQIDPLMTGAGYTNALKYSFDLWYNDDGHYGDTEASVAQLMKTQLENTGYFTVTLKHTTWTQYKTQFGKMPTFLLGWWYDYPDESNYIDPFVGHGAFDLGTNYSSPTMDGYINTMLSSSDASARVTAQKDAQKLMAEDVPLIPLFTMQKQLIAYTNETLGVHLEPSEILHFDTLTKEGFVLTSSTTSTASFSSSKSTSSTIGLSPGFELLIIMLVLPITYLSRKRRS